MAQDFDSNLAGVVFKTAIDTRIKNSLDALRSTFLGGTAPATTVAGMQWFDTSAGVLKIRDASNAAWVVIGQVGGDDVRSHMVNKGTATASFDYYLGSFYRPAEIVLCRLLTRPTGATSTASIFWTFQIRNLTQSLNLLSTAKSTWTGSAADDPVEDVPYAITPNQNLSVAAGDVLEFQAVETGAAKDLVETCIQLFYKPR